MKINRLLTNICTSDLEKSKTFYTTLFNLNVEYDSDWFVHLTSSDGDFELGLILQTHEIVPAIAKGKIKGTYLTFVIDDVNSGYHTVKDLDVEILEAPKETPYGQTRMLVLAPEGTVCDISSPTIM